MRHLSTCCAAAPKLSHPPLCELPLKSVPPPLSVPPLPPPVLATSQRVPYSGRLAACPALPYSTQSQYHTHDECMSPYIIAPQNVYWNSGLWGVSLPTALSLFLFPYLPSPSRLSRANCDELLIVLCASSRNALFIFNHRTNTNETPRKIWPVICSTICANNWRIKAKHDIN